MDRVSAAFLPTRLRTHADRPSAIPNGATVVSAAHYGRSNLPSVVRTFSMSDLIRWWRKRLKEQAITQRV